MSAHRKLKYIKSINDLDLYLYKPSIGHWFFEHWDGYIEDKGKRSLKQKIRMFIEFIGGGYSIFYACHENSIAGYALVAKGGRRIRCSCKYDIVIGPYFTVSSMRDKGIMSALISAILHELNISFDNAYCYILKSNEASIKVARKCGFSIIGGAKTRGLFRNLYLTDDEKAKFYILRFANKKA